MKHTIGDLYQMQSLSLKHKITMTQARIRGWYDHFDGQVYVSFSGGKDSTVLVDIVTKMGYTDIPLVFVDTGLEYPEIREFVKSYGDRVTWLKPKMNFKQVIEKYGYPFVSKEIAQTMHEAQRKYRSGEQIASYRALKLEGKLIDKNTGQLSSYNIPQWRFLLDAPFLLSHKCCDSMKKHPAMSYEKSTGKKMITAEMASESRLRHQKWMQYGCNGFDMKRPKSMPMAFWTEQDVLEYIKINHLPICSVYGEIVEDREGTDEVEGQMTISDMQGFEDMSHFDAKKLPLKTTGCNRTGCMFCGFGCHLEKEGEGRFERMKETHPKQYEWIMKPWDEGGLGYKQVIDWINEHGNMNIRY